MESPIVSIYELKKEIIVSDNQIISISSLIYPMVHYIYIPFCKHYIYPLESEYTKVIIGIPPYHNFPYLHIILCCHFTKIKSSSSLEVTNQHTPVTLLLPSLNTYVVSNESSSYYTPIKLTFTSKYKYTRKLEVAF